MSRVLRSSSLEQKDTFNESRTANENFSSAKASKANNKLGGGGNYPAVKRRPRSAPECFAGLAFPREHIGAKRLLDRLMGGGVNCNGIIPLVDFKTWVEGRTRQLARDLVAFFLFDRFDRSVPGVLDS